MSERAPRQDGPVLVGICVVRNEGDLVAQALRHAANLHDAIVVADAASDDDTVERVREVARGDPRIIFLGALPEPKASGQVRRHLWALFQPHVPPRTWWSLVDGDEFAHEDLRRAVIEAEAQGADHVQGLFADFQYLESEARAWREGRETVADRARPIEERRLSYWMSSYSVRLFRQHRDLRWPVDSASPTCFVRPLRRRVHYRHYQWRDLDQIADRQRTRSTLPMPPQHRKIHLHWGFTVEQCITPDGTPSLRRHQPGAALQPDAKVENLTVYLKQHVSRRLRAFREALAPPHAPALFGDAPAGDLLRRALAEGRRR